MRIARSCGLGIRCVLLLVFTGLTIGVQAQMKSAGTDSRGVGSSYSKRDETGKLKVRITADTVTNKANAKVALLSNVKAVYYDPPVDDDVADATPSSLIEGFLGEWVAETNMVLSSTGGQSCRFKWRLNSGDIEWISGSADVIQFPTVGDFSDGERATPKRVQMDGNCRFVFVPKTAAEVKK